MNTPKSCCSCKNIYYNILCENDPSYTAECKKDLELGNINCPEYKNYKENKSNE